MISWFKRTWIVAATTVVMGAVVASAWAQGKKLDVDFQDATLVEAIQALTKQTGLQFVIADRNASYNMITLSLRDVSPEKAIETVVMAAGGYVERDASGVFIIRFGAKPTANTTPVNTNTTIAAPKIITKIRPRHWDAHEILLEITGRFVFDPNSGMKEAKAISNFWSPTQNPVPNVIIPASGVNVFGSNTPNSNLAPTNESPNDIWLPGDSVNQVGGFGGGGQPGGGGGQPGGGGQGNGGRNNTALQSGTGLVPQGLDYIAYDPTDGSLVVSGTDEAIRQLRQIIDLFDVAPKQVEVKVEFITTSTSISKSFGFDWQYNRGAIFTGTNPGTFARSGDPIFVNYATGNLTTRLRAQLLTGEGKVVTAPLVRTLNNQTALVAQNITTTYFSPTVTGSAGGNIITYTPVPIQVQTQLAVRPRIMDDGFVAMSLAPTISDLGQVRRGPDGSEIPDVLTQTVSVSLRVKDGETIVLGGLNRTQTFSNTNKFPILGDLPIIGQFFRSTRSERNDQELLIFVTPVVIKDDSEYIGP